MDKAQSSEELGSVQNLTIEEHNRNKYYREHILQYGFLILSFVVALVVLFELREFVWKAAVIAFLFALYLVFGIWHHLEEKTLSSKHFLEYLLVAAIIFLVLMSIFI